MTSPLPRAAALPGGSNPRGSPMLAGNLVPALLLGLLTLFARIVPATAQALPEEPGRLRLGAAELALSGRVQTQFNTTSVDGQPATQWLMRRVRLEARVRVSDLVGGKIQPDFSGERFVLKDAYVQLGFSPTLQVLVGQAHRPFALLTRFSSLRMPPIEKGAEIRGRRAWDEVNLVKDLGYSSRDIGIQLHGASRSAPLGLEYAAAVLQGPDASRILKGGAPQLVARLAVSPAEWLSVGGSWSRHDFAADATRPEAGTGRPGSAVALDLAIQPVRPGILLLAEVTRGDFDPWTGSTFHGAHAWAAYDLVSHGAVTMIEPLLRVSRGAIQSVPDASDGTLITPGINVYLGGLNRIMLNYDVWLPAAGDAADRSLKVMVQLSF